MNNLFDLANREKLTASFPFGSDSFFDNTISGDSIFKSLGNSSDPTTPRFYVVDHDFEDVYSPGYEDIDKDDPDSIPEIVTNNLTNLYAFLIPQIIAGATMQYIGKASTQADPTLAMLDSVSIKDKITNPTVGRLTNVSNKLSQLTPYGNLTASEAKPNEAETKLFNEMARAFVYTNPSNPNGFNFETKITKNAEPYFYFQPTHSFHEIDERFPSDITVSESYPMDLFHL
jgi:hypothetical protein